METKKKDFRVLFAKCLLNESINIEDDISSLINIIADDCSLFKDENIQLILKKFFLGYIKCYIYNKDNNIDNYFKHLNSNKLSLSFLTSISKNRAYPECRFLIKEYLFLINYNPELKYNAIHDSLVDYLDVVLF